MRYLLLLLILIALSCETHSFDSDQRQLIAKDVIRRQIRKAHAFDISGFSQDTLASYSDTSFKHPIKYSLNFTYIDSLGDLQKKKGVVVFTPDGKSVIKSEVIAAGE